MNLLFVKTKNGLYHKYNWVQKIPKILHRKTHKNNHLISRLHTIKEFNQFLIILKIKKNKIF